MKPWTLLSAWVLSILFVFCVTSDAEAAPALIVTGPQTGQHAHVDPIVSPGVRSTHQHSFTGAVGITPDTDTSAELRTLPSTWRVAGNHSGFWLPTLYENGVRVPEHNNKGCLLYYQLTSSSQVPPENMRGVTQEVGYRNSFGGGTVTALPPASSPNGEFVISGFFRGVRDFGVGNFGNVRFFCRYNIGAGTIGNLTLGGPTAGVDGATANMDTVHADYIWAWDRAVFQQVINQCVRDGSACGTDPVIA